VRALPKKEVCSYPFGMPKKKKLVVQESKFYYTGHGQAEPNVAYFSVSENIPYSHKGMYQKYVQQIWKSICEAKFYSGSFFFKDIDDITYQLILHFFSHAITFSDEEYDEILLKARLSKGFSTDIVEAFAQAGVLSEEQMLKALYSETKTLPYLSTYTQEHIAKILDTTTLLENMHLLSYVSLNVFLRRKEDITDMIRNSMTDFKGMPNDWVLKATNLDNLEDKRWDEVSWLKNLL
jgi:hypothetical protein